MRKYIIPMAIMLFCTVLKLDLLAQVPVAVLPFKGDDPNKDELVMKIKEILPKKGGIQAS